MNDRIRELSKQAQKVIWPADGNVTELTSLDEEKFAELIVRECTNIVLHYADVDEGVAVAKKHFGVE